MMNEVDGSGQGVLKTAVSHPTDENIERALGHPELRNALSGLTVEEFKKLGTVVSSYMVLRQSLEPGKTVDPELAALHPDVVGVLDKIGPEGLADLSKITEGPSSVKTPCTVIEF